MSKHTLGPWTTDSDYGHESVLGQDGDLVADCCITGRDRKTETNVANAHLIAAVPELLEALRKAISVIRQWHSMPLPDPAMDAAWGLYYEHAPEMAPIRAAIAKAEGRYA